MTDDLDALLAAVADVRTACAHCDEAFDGTLEDGRAWFAEHLAREHPEVRIAAPKARPKLRRTIGTPRAAFRAP